MNHLRQNNYISGQELGRITGITRSAVWKHIGTLRSEGYQIDSVPGKGYHLISAPDRVLPGEIKSGLNTRVLGKEIIYLSEATSTQETARIAATSGAPEGTLAIAEIQTDGRGRLGRVWASLPEGLSFSIVLRPDMQPSEALRIPLLTGIGVARAIYQITGCNVKLKWPNDIIIGDKKVSGILLEMSAEVDRLNWVIIGIGLNVNSSQKSIPRELKDIATSLQIETGKKISRVKLLQQILSEFEILYDQYNEHGFDPLRQLWKSMSNTIDSNVIITSSSGQITGKAIDIDHVGALMVRKDDGNVERIIAGDISLR